jgi:drug/metabolite transporter (DMT)-like permease
MDSSLFFSLMFVTVITTGLQMPLLQAYARKIDAVYMATIRNSVLIVAMLPLLLFASIPEIKAITEHIFLLLAASATGAIGLGLHISTGRYIGLGISNTIRNAVLIIASIVLGFTFLDERLSLLQFAIIVGLILFTSLLAYSRSAKSNNLHEDIPKGIILSVLTGLAHAVTFFLFTILSREINPFVATYFWESTIGVFLIIYSAFYFKNRRVLLSIGRKDVVRISLIGLLTIPSTLLYSIAINYGPIGLASAIKSSSIVIALVMGVVWFGDKITTKQVSLCAFILLTIFVLKLIS